MLLQTRTALRRGVPCHVRKGELCAQPDSTPQDPHGHGCQGGCGGRLHGICGSIFDDNNENHRICSACVAKAGKRKAPAADSAGKAQSKRPKARNGGSKKSQPHGGARARPDFGAQLEMLKLMDNKVTHEQIADRFGCSERLVRDVKKNRKKYETGAAAGGGGSQKNIRAGKQEEDSGDENTGLARRAPPAYGELSSHFGVLEAAAERRVATETRRSI